MFIISRKGMTTLKSTYCRNNHLLKNQLKKNEDNVCNLKVEMFMHRFSSHSCS